MGEKKLQEFVYTNPFPMIDAIRNVSGFEDSHEVPGHEKLMHDHSTPESYTTPEAVSSLADEVAKYKKLNPGFEEVVGQCNIPDHTHHSFSVSVGMRHHTNTSRLEGGLKAAIEAYKTFPKMNWVLIFNDRLLIVGMDGVLTGSPTLNFREKLLSQ